MTSADYDEYAPNYARRPNGGTDSVAFVAVEDRIVALGLSGTALDVGCGPGRSTRLLKSLGLHAIGLDVNESMLREARAADPEGQYVVYEAETAFPFEDDRFDVLFSSFVVLELETREALEQFAREFARVLRPGGHGFVVTTTPEFYTHRWVSSEVDFPENTPPFRSGQRLKAHLHPEGIVVNDTFWSDEDYRAAFGAGLSVEHTHRPLALDQRERWRDETRVAPYFVYELLK